MFETVSRPSAGSVFLTWWLIPFVAVLIISVSITFLLREWPRSQKMRKDYVCRVVRTKTRYNANDNTEVEEVFVDMRTPDSARRNGGTVVDSADAKISMDGSVYSVCPWDILYEREGRMRMMMVGIPILLAMIIASILWMIGMVRMT